MQPQLFLRCLTDGATRVNTQKSEVFPPRHYTTILSTQKIGHGWVCLHGNKKEIYSSKQSAVLACSNLVKNIFLLMAM